MERGGEKGWRGAKERKEHKCGHKNCQYPLKLATFFLFHCSEETFTCFLFIRLCAYIYLCACANMPPPFFTNDSLETVITVQLKLQDMMRIF